ncbi:hypothetical protein LQE93_10955 [Clostridium sp. NSJ-145]|uniref:hypothetical protein n=1 Tax=Clostridium sp. NSJ-145 TaxID=2897777 RepID=UPI001E2F6BCF|nr:hypothetical protein [Clostridium sp. NSJ-145]MCD2502298.1 hypothetical protein [Clostridium sp. NSJ-145]
MREELKLYRCIFLKENKNYIIGKDIFNSKIYYIKKNKETENFRIGTDNSFYAIKEECGKLFKKVILKVVNYDSVIETVM